LFYFPPNIVYLKNVIFFCSKDEGKGKAIPSQALTGPEGFRRLRLPELK
jgi:hypothetical protein